MGCVISSPVSRQLAVLLALVLLTVGWKANPVQAQDGAKSLSTAEIEQLVAPIALHPDALLSQILMASTYPLEVVEADRWVKAHPKVAGSALEEAMQKQPWDPSVKSLAAFSQVLEMMSRELSWMQQLGDAFLAQQADVLAAVQNLRTKADTAGNLKTTKEQRVERQTVTNSAGVAETVIVIEQSAPDVIYVPAYDPTIIYGAWAYPAYPPYYWYPPLYPAGRMFWFATGVAVGNSLWGRCDWGRRDVNINVNRYNNFNRTNITSNNWQHNAVHRKGVPYRDAKVADRYGKGRNVAQSNAREQFRGHADSGRRDLTSVDAGKRLDVRDKKPDLGGKKPDLSGKNPNLNAKKAAANKPAAKKAAARPQAKKPSPQKKASRPTQQPAAFKGVESGRTVRQESSRGRQSREVAYRGGGGGGHRGGGGGGGRGGGGRRR